MGLFASKTSTVAWSLVLPQAPFAMLHWNTFAPTAMALTEVVLVPADAIVPVPLTNVQAPVAGAFAGFAVNVAFGAVLQACWSAPAFAAPCALLFTMMATSSVLIGFAHAPLSIVHRKILVPTVSPVTPLVGDPGVLTVPLPLTKVQMPVLGGVGLLPASEVMVVGVHNC